jgi:hypothetical protein
MPQSVQLRSHVCKVTLHVLQPSAPDKPVTTPVPPLPPPLPSQTPPLPPVQPPHLPLEAGPPNPNPINGQQGWNTLVMSTPPTYTHPYGMLYPPAYPPVPHHPPYASIGAPPQPWGYTQYPMAPQPGPFLAHPLAAGDEDLHAHEAHGRVAHGLMGQDFVEHGCNVPTGCLSDLDARGCLSGSTTTKYVSS